MAVKVQFLIVQNFRKERITRGMGQMKTLETALPVLLAEDTLGFYRLANLTQSPDHFLNNVL